MKKTLIILTFLTPCFLFGQNVKDSFDKTSLKLGSSYLNRLEKNNVAINDTTDLFINDKQSKLLFYYALAPKEKIKGVLVILSSSGETPEEVFNNNIKLTESACDSNLLVIIPSVNNHVCLDKVVREFLNTVFYNAIEKYKAPKDKIIIGGLSLGGMISLRYTEQAYEGNNNTAVIPKAVFGVDPPVDLSTLYYQFQRDIERNFSQGAIQEAKFLQQELEKLLGGSPKQYPEKYIQYSMYSRTEKDGGNTKFLKNVPIRIYSDPDIDWQMKNRHRDYYDMNAPDQTAMINQLNQLGNDKAEFVNALGKGYRLDGKRHPHSWSIVEATSCLTWILKNIK
jgi:hypothetical protein